MSVFRTCLLKASIKKDELGIKGCDYEVVRDVPGKPVQIKLLGMPGVTKSIELVSGNRKFKSAGAYSLSLDDLVKGKSMEVSFPGKQLTEKYHRKLGDLTQCKVPSDAEALYEATCFAADNNALEVRALDRSGSTQIPQVQKARNAFLEQPLFINRGLWDRNMFDADDKTSFYIARRTNVQPLYGGSLRIDFGETINIDKLIVRCGSEHARGAFKYDETVVTYVSSNFKDWKEVKSMANDEIVIDLCGKGKIRYVRFKGTPEMVQEIEGYLGNKKLDRSKWRGSHLFAMYSHYQESRFYQ